MFKKIENVFTYIEKTIITVALLIMVIDIVLMISVRYLFLASLPFVEELGRYCLIWITFYGAGIVTRLNGHYALEIFLHKLPYTARNITEIFILAVEGVLMAGICLAGFMVLPDIYHQTSATMGFSMAYVYSCIPIGTFFCLYHIIGLIIDRLSSIKGGENFSEEIIAS